MTFLDTVTLERLYEPTFTEDAIQTQKESVQDCIAYLLLAGTNVDEKISRKINRLLTNLYEYDNYLQRELEAYCVTQE